MSLVEITDYGDLASINTDEPSGQSHNLSDLDNYQRELRRAVKHWFNAWHEEVTLDSGSGAIDLTLISATIVQPIRVKLNFTTSVTFSNFTNPVSGQMLILRNAGKKTHLSYDAAKMILQSSGSIELSAKELVVLVHDGSIWHQLTPVQINHQ